MKEAKNMTSNTFDAILSKRGRTVVGAIQGMLQAGSWTIVFDDGTGLTFTGAFWTEPADLIEKERIRLRERLAAALDAIKVEAEMAAALDEAEAK